MCRCMWVLRFFFKDPVTAMLCHKLKLLKSTTHKKKKRTIYDKGLLYVHFFPGLRQLLSKTHNNIDNNTNKLTPTVTYTNI